MLDLEHFTKNCEAASVVLKNLSMLRSVIETLQNPPNLPELFVESKYFFFFYLRVNYYLC